MAFGLITRPLLSVRLLRGAPERAAGRPEQPFPAPSHDALTHSSQNYEPWKLMSVIAAHLAWPCRGDCHYTSIFPTRSGIPSIGYSSESRIEASGRDSSSGETATAAQNMRENWTRGSSSLDDAS
jgi:hypothetical protein